MDIPHRVAFRLHNPVKLDGEMLLRIQKAHITRYLWFDVGSIANTLQRVTLPRHELFWDRSGKSGGEGLLRIIFS